MVSEVAFVERLEHRLARREGVVVGVGDDAAVLTDEAGTVLTHDLLVEDVHFRRSTTGLRDLGHKALAVNLSDLAAMGATAVAALVGLGLPADDAIGADGVEELLAGADALAATHAVTIVGGDLTSAPVLTVAVTAVGRMDGRTPVRRSGVRAGDLLAVTGTLGAAAAGLALLTRPELRATMAPELAEALVARQLRPQPALAAGRRLADAGVHAMMDVSDGLALDALRMGRASGLVVEIDLERVPLAPGVSELAHALGEAADLLAATGGEDYELLVALPQDALAGVADLVTVVGRARAGEAGVRLRRRGQSVEAERLGWQIDV